MYFTERRRAREFALQADELPRRLPRLRLRAPLLPRAAAAPGRVRARLPQRARGRPPRAAAGARLHPGRRPRLLHAGPGRRRGRLDLRGDRRALCALRLRATSRSSSRPARRSRSAPTSSGSRPRRRCARRSSARAASTRSTPATARSTGRRSTSTSPTRSAAPGSAAPASSTSRCPSASTSTYTGADNAEHRPVMIHRALLGSMERFAGILIEHYAGRFPVWLAPVQASVLPVADRHNDYAARGRRASCARPGVRVRVDERSESVGKKIRDAELAQAPLHAGRRRPRGGGGRSAVRSHDEGDSGTMSRRARSRLASTRRALGRVGSSILPPH